MTFLPSAPDLQLAVNQCSYTVHDDGKVAFTKLKDGRPVYALRYTEDGLQTLLIDTRSWTPQETLALFNFKV